MNEEARKGCSSLGALKHPNILGVPLEATPHCKKGSGTNSLRFEGRALRCLIPGPRPCRRRGIWGPDGRRILTAAGLWIVGP